MERVPYRRVTPSREYDKAPHINKHRRISYRTSQKQSGDTISVGETFIVQTILSVLILGVVLVISVFDIGPMQVARDGVRHILAGAETVDEFTTGVRQFGYTWLNIAPAEDAPNIAPEVYPIHPLAIIEEPNQVPSLWD